MKLKYIVTVIFICFGLSLSAFAIPYAYKYYVQTKSLKVVKVKKLPSPPSKEQVVAIIKKNLRDIEDCYNERLEYGLDEEGSLQIGWLLTGSGLASSLEQMRNDLDDIDLYECSAAAISEWRFPKDLVLKVHYTFHLRQKKRSTASKVPMDHLDGL